MIIDINFEGFDNFVSLIFQKLDDLDGTEHESDEDIQQEYPAENGSTFILPGEYDVIIMFAPQSNNDETTLVNNGGSI